MLSSKGYELLSEVIQEWHRIERFTYHEKRFNCIAMPSSGGEYLFRFTSDVKSFFKDKSNQELIQLNFESKAFIVRHLTKDAYSKESKHEREELRNFLADFDDEFEQFVYDKLLEHEYVATSDPMYF